jgi:hypothetical protein
VRRSGDRLTTHSSVSQWGIIEDRLGSCARALAFDRRRPGKARPVISTSPFCVIMSASVIDIEQARRRADGAGGTSRAQRTAWSSGVGQLGRDSCVISVSNHACRFTQGVPPKCSARDGSGNDVQSDFSREMTVHPEENGKCRRRQQRLVARTSERGLCSICVIHGSALSEKTAWWPSWLGSENRMVG